MKNEADALNTNLCARIPRRLYRRVRVHCITKELELRGFIRAAIVEKLARAKRQGKGTK